MLKNSIKLLLQRLLGFNNFLFLFSVITIQRLHLNKNERDFIYFLSLLPAGANVLDIGANIGIMTVPLSKKAVNAKVYAFEPIPQNVVALKRIIKFYKLTNVTLFENALGEQAGELKMVMPIVNGVKMQGLCHVTSDDHFEEGDHFSVAVKKLDDITELDDAGVIGGIKIDVENFELEVFKGAEKLLHRHRPIIYCELWDNDKRSSTINYMEKQFGYKVKVYDGKNLVTFSGQQAINFFLVPS